jgi:hypothetical protein
MNADKWIIITTINPPTTALHKFAAMREAGWNTVVVGDTKTPADWALEGTEYLSIAQQEERYGELARLIPTRHYSRKNLGYLYALEHGAKLVLDTDDDNIPYDAFGTGLDEQVTGRALDGPGWVNVYRHFTDHQRIWPRGLPLDKIQEGGTLADHAESRPCPVQQFLADGDPDVDAIFRLVIGELLDFDRDAEPVIVSPGTWVPFNSQNTVFYPQAFPLLYLPCHVSFRMTDIWRSFVAQSALARDGLGLSFHAPTVVQERNAHDFMKDFEDEVPGYLHNDAIMNVLKTAAAAHPGGDQTALALALWESLCASGHVPEKELPILRAWHAQLASL